ncbi:MAG: alkaline phosphatase family protein [Pseudomonadota bacterium]
MQKNAIWIMCDQLRWDYLSCYGHPHLHTPNIDSLAEQGVKFNRAYVQSTVCGPSRMSAYTGRYMRSHGSTWNGVPLNAGELTLGDHLAPLGVRNVLVGKTHMVADKRGLDRLGIPHDSKIGQRIAQCGFEVYERDDGLHPDGDYDPAPDYDAYLAANGFEADNPWEHWANSAEGPNGEILNGWLWAHADKPARIPNEHAETPYMTRRAMDFIREAKADGRPWSMHLSYIKPHWPYMVSAPYHDMYCTEHLLPVVRDESERQSPHPLNRAFMDMKFSKNFSRDEVRERVIPAYMGLIKQIDDQLGLLFSFLKENGLWDSTMIIFSSDHGEYLGDHWLGEKYLYHEQSMRIPLIVYDPSPEADQSRGCASDELVELIDVAPTLVDFFGGKPATHILEGRSLTPLLRGDKPSEWREAVFSEYDYSFDPARLAVGVSARDARIFIVFDGRWKMIHSINLPPLLFDLESDPNEFDNLAENPEFQNQLNRMKELLFSWAINPPTRTTLSNEFIESFDDALQVYDSTLDEGIIIGYWDEAELEAEQKKRKDFLQQQAPAK